MLSFTGPAVPRFIIVLFGNFSVIKVILTLLHSFKLKGPLLLVNVKLFSIVVFNFRKGQSRRFTERSSKLAACAIKALISCVLILREAILLHAIFIFLRSLGKAGQFIEGSVIGSVGFGRKFVDALVRVNAGKWGNIEFGVKFLLLSFESVGLLSKSRLVF